MASYLIAETIIAPNGTSSVITYVVDAGRRHASVLDEFGNDAADDIGGNRKADAGAGAGRRDNCRIDADQPARRIQQGSARIAGIDRGVGLDHVGDFTTAAGGQPSLERADNA